MTPLRMGPQLADVKHNFVARTTTSFVRQSKEVWRELPKPVDYAIGGWQMGGTFSSHTGFPAHHKDHDRSALWHEAPAPRSSERQRFQSLAGITGWM